MRLRSALTAALAVGLACSSAPPEPRAGSGAPESPREEFERQGETVGVLAGGTLYLSGVAPADSQAAIGDQTRSAMERLGEALGMAGLGYSHVVSCHVNLSDMDNYAEMNAVYGSFYEEGRYPARTTVEVMGLPGGAGVLLLCTAYADASGIAVIRPPSEQIPPAMGPYSPAVRAGSTVYVSGQGGRDPITGEISDTAAGQAARTLETIAVILEAAGLDFGNVVLANSYFPPSTEAGDVNAEFAAVFSAGGAPSHSNVPLSRLPGDIAVEITFVAVDDSYVTRLFMHDSEPTPVTSPVSLSGGIAYAAAVTGTGETFADQVASALETQAAALRLASMDLPNVVRVVAYLSDADRLAELRSLLADGFGGRRPSLAAVQTRHAAGDTIALEMIAVQ